MKKRKRKKNYTCYFCGNSIDASKGEPLIKQGKPICARCLWKETRELFMSFRGIRERLNANRHNTIVSARENTVSGQRCPANCKMRTSTGNTVGCGVIQSGYKDGACPFYKSRNG